MQDRFSLEGRTAIVTGASRGIGFAIARSFIDAGARVVITARGEEALRAAAAELGPWAIAVPCDNADPAAITAMVERAAQLGPIDILVNNAGVSLPAAIDADGFEQAWEATLAVNLTGHATLVRACVDDLGRHAAGRVVNIASTEGLGATPYLSPYTASKHGVIGLTRALAVELGRRGITVNCVCPGPIHTGMTAAIPDEHKERFARRRVPVGRYGSPEEVAHATLSLVLPAASFINAAVLVVDGGLTAQNT
jgi:3-oxoacyl-[acyl-carrier protein] reductase